MARPGFLQLLRQNPNYRYTWMGQVVSEVGDHFNTIAVFSLALANTGSGLVVSALMLSRAIPAVLAGPLAGILLDRLDRKRIMIWSDLVRAVVAVLFIFAVGRGDAWLLYLLSGLLMFASPFFTSGRAAILPTITSREELHTANTLTQTTQWTALTLGSFLGGASVVQFGYEWAFVFNALSFLFSAWAISRLRVKKGFKALREALTESDVVRPWSEYAQGLRYMAATPLLFAIGLVHVGWATGGGAAQVLFPLFGEAVFNRGPGGIGMLWGCAGIGLLLGGAVVHRIGDRLSFNGYKRAVIVCYVIHGGSYVLFAQAPQFWQALIFMAISRGAVAVSAVMNFSQLLRHVPDAFRGRVFSTIESLTWSTMMLSMTGAGFASEHVSPRVIGVVAGCLSSMTAAMWGWFHWSGRLVEPPLAGVDPKEVEVHGDPER
ncbi:MAG TPA: MFS transporter [Solibacterales bacterium]|nr:MFS transporter [Bryobacterales bacterium]